VVCHIIQPPAGIIPIKIKDIIQHTKNGLYYLLLVPTLHDSTFPKLSTQRFSPPPKDKLLVEDEMKDGKCDG